MRKQLLKDEKQINFEENSNEIGSLESETNLAKDLLKSTIYSAGSKYLKSSRNLCTPSIPKAANWGWSHLPWPAKLMIGGVLCGVISVTTPYWVCLKFDSYGHSTFGLFHYCNGEVCTSIHDNLVEGRSVDAWFHLVQGNMCIGVACSIVSLAIMTNNLEGNNLKMSPTTLVAAISILAISALEQFFGLLIFSNYVENTDFLFDMERIYNLDFYGSYYIGIISTVCSLVCSLILFINYRDYRNYSEASECLVSDEKLVEIYNEYVRKQHQIYYDNNGYYNFDADGCGVGIAGIKGFLRNRKKNNGGGRCYDDDDDEVIMKNRVFEEDMYGFEVCDKYGEANDNDNGGDDNQNDNDEDDYDDNDTFDDDDGECNYDDGDDSKKLISTDEDDEEKNDDDEVNNGENDEEYVNDAFNDD